jgi:ATP-binding cassette subfamily F protein uup
LHLKTTDVNFLSLENLTKSYGEKVLFKDITLQINKGQKVALVAKNGSGKSTLLRVIAGKEAGEGEHFRMILRRDVRLGILDQDPEFHPSWTIMDAAFSGDNPMLLAVRRYEKALIRPDHEGELQEAMMAMDDLKAWDFEAKIKEILFKLNITDLEQPVTTLSGGQQKRLALAQLLIDDPEFIILDEPTNHLDLDMIEWLEAFLSQANLTLFMVTHDRYFLERVCDTIVELDRGTLYRYSGNYSEFLEKKALRHENEGIELEKSQKLMRKELDWIRRAPKARGTKAKARVDAFDIIQEKASKKLDNNEIQIDIKGARLGSKILEAQYISKAYGEQVLIRDFNYKFKKGERVGIVGKNGMGKSTLLKLLTGEIRPDGGKVVVGGTVQFGYYTQDGIQLKDDKRVLDVITDIAEYIPLEKGQKLGASQLLERFLFSRPQQQVYVSQLSGGERRRLYLLTVLMQNPNFLILDEPTNDLDIITLNVLEDFLLDFPGCILIVSHDRYFMDKLVDHLFIFEGDGQIRDFNGNYNEYRTQKMEEEAETRRQLAQERKQDTPQKPKPALSQEHRKEMSRLEKELKRLEARKTEIHEQFSSGELSNSQIETLGKELAEIQDALDEKEMRWLELSELG